MQQSLKTIIKELLIEWQNKPLPDLYYRDSSAINLDNMYNILAIIGPRRAWKTYYMYQLIHELIENFWIQKNDILFLDFENYKLVELQTNDVWEILNIFYEIHWKYPKYLFFDEIHTLEHRWNVLRTFHNDWYNIIISWSSSKLLLNEITTELRWRYFHRLILPFSFQEIVEKNNILFDKNTQYDEKKRSKIKKLFDSYMEFWWYPLVLSENDEYRKRELLEEYYSTIFYKDLLERHNIQDKKSIEFLMNYFLNTYSSIFSASKFEKYLKSLGIWTSKATLLKYTDYIQESFFVINCPKFSWSPKWEIVNPNKIYLIDPGFCKMGNNYSKNKWKVLENIVAIELYRQWKRFFYFNENKECDFIIRDKIHTTIESAIQVTWELENTNIDREIQWLIDAMNKCNLNEWYIITYDTFNEIKENWKEIHIVPIWKWILRM